jgi:hypothetical protein
LQVCAYPRLCVGAFRVRELNARLGLRTVGGCANDSPDAVGESAPVCDRVVDAVGLCKARPNDRDNLRGSVGPGDPPETRPVGEMSVRVARSVL